ncbi:MAG: hypothetical protein V4592_01235 [Bacteroidota bacterium]
MRCIFALALTILGLNAGASVKKMFMIKSHHEHIKADTDSVIKKQSVSVGITAGSDASFFGRTSPKRYRYYTADLIYNAKSGFFAYGTIWKVAGSFPKLDEVDAGAGYVYHLTKNIKGSVSYTHFFFNRDAQIIKSLSTNDIDLKTTYDWKLFKTSMSFDYLFGKANDAFVTPSISRYYETKFGIFDDKDFLSFTPGISIILGTQNFVENYSNIERDDPNSDNGYAHDADNLHTAHFNRQFNLLNYSFRLPIAYNRPHYTIEANTKYSIPVNAEGAIKNRKELFFNLTFYYVFF